MTTQLRRAIAVLIAITAAVALAACGDTDSPDSGPGDAGHDHPTGQGPVPGAMPDDSVQEALSRIYSWEPLTQANSGVAMLNALPWLSGEMAEAATRPGDDRMRPMRQWAQWRKEKAIVTATVHVVPAYDDAGSKTTQREASVLQRIQRADGSVDAYSLITYQVDLALEADNCWRVWRIQITDSQPLTDGVIQ